MILCKLWRKFEGRSFADIQETHKETNENINMHDRNTTIKEIHVENNRKELRNQKKVKSPQVHLEIVSRGVAKENIRRGARRKGKLHLEKLFEDKEVGKLINNLNLEELDMIERRIKYNQCSGTSTSYDNSLDKLGSMGLWVHGSSVATDNQKTKVIQQMNNLQSVEATQICNLEVSSKENSNDDEEGDVSQMVLMEETPIHQQDIETTSP